MVGTAQVVPQTIVVVEHAVTIVLEIAYHRIDTVSPACSLSSWNKTGDGWFGRFLYKIVFHTSRPPGYLVAVACNKAPVGSDATILYSIVNGL